jgi:hypothetical protein
MKKSEILGLVTIVIMAFTPGLPCTAPLALQVTSSPVSRGAANLTELGNALFQALQTNNFDLLTGYLPSEAELSLLRQKGSEDLKALMQAHTAADVESRFKNDFQALIQQSVSQTLNWSDLSMAEARAGKPDPKNQMLLPVELRLQTKLNQFLTIRFEALRLHNRYFLFERVQMKS